MGTSAGRVILFGIIPTTILDTTPMITPPNTQTNTTVIPTEYDPSEDPSSDNIPPLLAISSFLSSADDTTDNDTPDTPPSPTHGTPFTEIISSTQRSHVIPRRQVMILAPGHPIPHGRPYRYHLNGPVHIMTARKRVGPLPVQQLVVRHSVDHSLSDYFCPDDLARDSSLDSSSEASSDFHSDASSDSVSRNSLSDHSSPDLPSTSAGPSRKRRRSPMTYVPTLSPVSGALSPVHANLIPSPKMVRDSGYLADVEAEIDECIAYAYALRDRGIDARVVVEAVDQVESETGARGPVEVRVERVTHPVMPDDIPEPAQEGAVEVTYETLGDLVQRIVGVKSAVTALIERITELEKDNRRLRGTASVERNGNRRNGGNGNRGNGGNGNGGNGGNENRGNGENGNGNRNRNNDMNYRGFMPVARECTFQDFLKCKPQNFSGTEGIDNALTWWNTYKRTIGVDVAYAMKWAGHMRLMTEVYCPRNEIQKMETELWNLKVKGNDLTAYTQRFQELILLCTRMVPDEEDKVERFIGESCFLHLDSFPYGRPYRYHLNRPVYMITARKKVGPLPTHRLAVRHSVDYSSSDHFSLDDSSRDSSSSSSSETSSRDLLR
ncbi:putative reverse transcriptase domain-containing protein [Tanacetum coccineum]|uniref:Reverse transcriptase domain-containing protein n=1 Tax=Tanacetum coccineum TaxID=301880 RepID=A0ABQ5BFE3_9ASTR